MREFSLQFKIWHWLNVLAVSGLLGTFFLRKTFLSYKDNMLIIMEKLQGFSIEISAEQAKIVAKAIRAPMWEWHILFGYLFAALLLWRIVMILKDGFGFEENPNTHMKWIYRSYKVIYLIFIFMAISGLVLSFYKDLGIAKESAHFIKENHELLAWVIVWFVPLHITGVLKANASDQKGLISKILS